LISKDLGASATSDRRPFDNRLAPSDNQQAPAPIPEWELVVEGPEGRVERKASALFDWRDDPRLRLVASPGRYRATVEVAEVEPGAVYLLDLGRVFHAADVALNGAPVARLLFSPFVADVTRALRPGRNTIEVVVRSPLLNRFIGYGERGDARFARFKGREPLAAGLLGPVVLRVVRP
jgi:hypothetical protein